MSFSKILDKYRKTSFSERDKGDRLGWIISNNLAKEHEQPRYILDLLLSIINVSMQTVEIVEGLPKLSFETSKEGADVS